MSRVFLSCAVASLFCVSTVSAHHTVAGRTHPTVSISQQVMVDGQPLAPGTYQIWVSDQIPTTGAGTTPAQRVVEFATKDDRVVAKTIAEWFPAARNRAVGTSGSSGSKATAQLLRGGEFVRVSFNDADGRYLIHLPTGSLNEPAPQAQSPSRIELPPSPQAAPNPR